MHTNMNDRQIDELINKALREEQAIPEGLGKRLENKIDSWATEEEKKTRSLSRKRTLYWLSGIAAAVFLCIGIFQPDIPLSHSKHRLADTYSDPKEAAEAAQKALLFMSQNLNKGIDQAQEARQEISKVNDILNKHLNN